MNVPVLFSTAPALSSVLSLSRNKIQFILTSASSPQNEENKVRKFVCDLTALSDAESSNIQIITGESVKTQISQLHKKELILKTSKTAYS